MKKQIGDVILDVKNISLRFGGVKALTDISFNVREHEIRAIIGPNGAGKSSMLNCINGVYTPQMGTISFRGQTFDHMDSRQVAEMGIARTFQNLRLFQSLSCRDNVLVGLHRQDRLPWPDALLGTPRARRHHRQLLERAQELLELLEIGHLGDQQAAGLSYGDRRRLEMARALGTAPQLLLLDEPAAGMNPTEKEELRHLIRNLRERFALTVLIIEHHVPLMLGLCDRLAVLNFGRRIALGTPDAVRNDPAVIEAYLGGQA